MLYQCKICGHSHDQYNVHCSKCKALVAKRNIPTRAQGRCWRCEIKKLRAEIKELQNTYGKTE